MTQTVYRNDLLPPIAGVLQGDGTDRHGTSDTDAFEPGIVVIADPTNAPRGLLKLTGAADPWIGVTHHQSNLDNQTLAGDLIWPVDSMVAYRKVGLIWCRCEEAMVVSDTPFVRYAADTAPLDILGSLRNDDPGAEAEDVSASMRIAEASVGATAGAINAVLMDVDFNP